MQDVDVLTHRQAAAVAAPIHFARILHCDQDDPAAQISHVVTKNGSAPLGSFLAEHDNVINCVLQETDAPLMFVTDDDLAHAAPGTPIVDVSCDEATGFSGARPTTFAEPTFMAGHTVVYHAVDHSPSYFWNSATWEISQALLLFPPSWEEPAPGTPTPRFAARSRAATG